MKRGIVGFVTMTSRAASIVSCAKRRGSSPASSVKAQRPPPASARSISTRESESWSVPRPIALTVIPASRAARAISNERPGFSASAASAKTTRCRMGASEARSAASAAVTAASTSMPPPIDSMERILLRSARADEALCIGTTRCAAVSTAQTAMRSSSASMSSTSAVAWSARSIFVRPPSTGIVIEPERSSATAIAIGNLRCSRRSSSETGRMSSTGDLCQPPGPNALRPPVSARPPPASRTQAATFASPTGPKSSARRFSTRTPDHAASAAGERSSSAGVRVSSATPAPRSRAGRPDFSDAGTTSSGLAPSRETRNRAALFSGTGSDS